MTGTADVQTEPKTVPAVNSRTARWRPEAPSRTVGVIVLVLLIAAPWIADVYTISIMSRMLVIALLTVSVSFLTGVSGLPTLGQAAYFGIGGYTAGLLSLAGYVIGPVQVLAGMTVGALVALATGSVVVRTRGVTFLMLTFAIGELFHSAAGVSRDLTGGTDGLPGIPPVVPLPGMAALTNDGLVFYYVLAVFLPLFLLTETVVRSPFGLALRSIRDNEARMRATGYHVNRYLLAGYGMAGGLAGAAGALWMAVLRYISPNDLGFSVAALALLAAVIGGLGSMWGACAGAALLVLVRDYIGGEQISVAGYTVTGPLL
ncbi:MAG TPA: branched-chain amino acid ABC transporter permease, partial [Micromonosporaceae bacterium]|nr:branched-chain amino acid ABC transporter permease [Micromonosporaceae bacterium]